MQEVTGSIPVFSTRKKSTAQQCVVLFLFVRNFCLSQTSEALAQPEERRAWTARVHRDLKRPGILHQKNTVLRRKYGAFLFTEAGFWGLHCFACTVFRLLQAVPIQPPIFDFTLFSKRNVCSPVFQQAAALSPLNRRSKRRWSPTIREATAFVDYRMSQP